MECIKILQFFQDVQTKFINYARKQIDKSEVKEEIRLRSPSNRRPDPRGSIRCLAVNLKRTSVGNILSQVPYLQHHLSEANLVTVNEIFFSIKKLSFFYPRTIRF